jgi:hypothetical protein
MNFLTEQRVNLGVNPNADESVRHGVLWVDQKTSNERVNLRVPVIIDKPKLLARGMNYATWRRLKRQIEKMGINATHLELKIEGNHYCYQLDEYKELYARGKGTPLWRAATA